MTARTDSDGSQSPQVRTEPGEDRPLLMVDIDGVISLFGGGGAWIDDAFDESCHTWAATRPAPTLLVQTEPTVGLTSTERELLVAWATYQRSYAESRAGARSKRGAS